MNESLKTTILGPEHLAAKPYHTVFLGYFLPITVFKVPLTMRTNCALPWNAGRKCTDNLISVQVLSSFKRGNPTPGLWGAICDSDKQNRRAALSINGRLSEMWLDFHRTACSSSGPPGPGGKCREDAWLPVALASCWVSLWEGRAKTFPNVEHKVGTKWPKECPSWHKASQRNWHWEEHVHGLKHTWGISQNKCLWETDSQAILWLGIISIQLLPRRWQKWLKKKSVTLDEGFGRVHCIFLPLPHTEMYYNFLNLKPKESQQNKKGEK